MCSGGCVEDAAWYCGSYGSETMPEHECGWEEEEVTDRSECGNKRKWWSDSWDRDMHCRCRTFLFRHVQVEWELKEVLEKLGYCLFRR